MFQWITEHASSIFQLVLYSFVFYIILGIIYAKNKKEDIISNWSQYRFKPYILPISGFINPIEGKSAVQSTLDNFTEFLWSSFKNFFSLLMKPVEYMFSIIKSLLANLEEIINKFRGQLTVMRNLILGIIMNMMKKIENIMTATIFTFGKINEMVKRQLGVYENIVYLLQTMTITMRSFVVGTFDHMMNFTEGAMWALPIFTLGAPGVVFPLMAFCFAEGTIINMIEGNAKIENVKIGDILQDGSIVLSKMKYYHNGPIFNYRGTFVTGEHYVMLEGTWTKIKNIQGLSQYQYRGYLYNLNTTSNKMYIGNEIYLDYDEYSNIDLAENENNSVLNILNKNGLTDTNLILRDENDRRYKLGFTESTLLDKKYIGHISIGDKLNNNKRTVLGIIAHLHEPSRDKIYLLDNVGMTEWVKVFHNDNWINVRDHPNAKLIDYRGKYLYSIITSDNIIEFNDHLKTRDFIEITN